MQLLQTCIINYKYKRDFQLCRWQIYLVKQTTCNCVTFRNSLLTRYFAAWKEKVWSAVITRLSQKLQIFLFNGAIVIEFIMFKIFATVIINIWIVTFHPLKTFGTIYFMSFSHIRQQQRKIVTITHPWEGGWK